MAVRDVFKQKRMDFIRDNYADTLRFVSNGMSKKESLLFKAKIIKDVGYSSRNNKVVICRIFKNSLDEINLLKMLESL